MGSSSRAIENTLQHLVDDIQEDIYDYILAFRNPWDVPSRQYENHNFSWNIKSSKAEEKFQMFFKSNSADTVYLSELKEFQSFLAGKDNIKYQDLAQFTINCVLKLLQQNLHLDVKGNLSEDCAFIILKIRASEENLQVEADLCDYILQFRPDIIDNLDFQKISPYGPYEKRDEIFDRIYKHYDENENESENGSLFKHIDRIRLVNSMITGIMELSDLQKNSILEDHFPSSSTKILNDLKSNWATLKTWNKKQDLEKLRNYFGEKLTMYFAWLEMYVWWLIWPAVLGAIFGIINAINGKDFSTDSSMSLSEALTLLFSLFVSIASTLMDQLWVRKQNLLAWQWGLTSFEQNEEQMPDFKGAYTKDPVTGKRKKVDLNQMQHHGKVWIGYSIMMFFVSLVVICIVGLFFYRSTLKDKQGWGLRFLGYANAIQIKIMNFIYRKVAKKLTDWENYETRSQYMDALTIKLFSFQFVNSYISLIYIAFIKGRWEGCADGDCMYELSVQLGAIYFINLFLNLIELGLPYLKGKWKMYKHKKNSHGALISKEDHEISLSSYETPLDDYMEMVIGYGYVVLFSVAFSWTPLIVLCLSALELRVDAWKLCHLTKRPFPAQDNSIGVWMIIIQIMAIVGAATNTGIVIFTSNVFDLSNNEDKWVLFIIIEHALFILKFLISIYIPDVPEIARKGKIWSERIVNEKLYGKLSDTDLERSSRNLNFRAISDSEHIDAQKIIESR